ncbi:23S rRNA (uracil(1939)-C(5))-methyltransferase RlmD [Blautia wexlerae]|uniref:23S rRNA (Uracil(1939)-C(5))-methyltransferase RlmD n=1 Tax=Blautia wexlerae TaxID=418240 RepID=A0ABX2GLJ8_9FIRM|nr:23S rRNA (uracil(1939)-C(5))-methyltransferase RlmD [Blautia wexlerae]NSF73231.1 23S rRNA (uracil(1939)-C(5))-methyltransferase RlmD [Blautia wexlerae]
MEEKREKPQLPEKCKVWKKCGGCQFQGVPYTEQIKIKQKNMNKLLKKYGNVKPIIGMENPFYYRNKVHAVFDRDKKGNIICGTYEAGTHRVVPVEECMIEDKTSQEIIRAIRDMLKSFRIKTYDEDTGYGLLRHILVRRGFSTDEIMVVLVVASPIFPSKNNFVKALRKKFPQISTVVLNVNDKKTSMVLGERDIVLYGKGFIRDRLCGCTFRISPQSFYQVNPVQTELLYKTAIEYAGLGRKERVIDAYCGIGTIGLVAAGKAREVIGIELNKNAVRDAIVNARENKITNARFYQGDAGEFMEGMVSEGERADVVFMDPPRTGSTEKFLTSMVKLGPSRIVYISCGPDTLARDLEFLTKHGYVTRKIQPVDMFSFTEHCEIVCLLTKQFTERTSTIAIL